MKGEQQEDGTLLESVNGASLRIDAIPTGSSPSGLWSGSLDNPMPGHFCIRSWNTCNCSYPQQSHVVETVVLTQVLERAAVFAIRYLQRD
jgi:hypothetical protein